MANVTDSPGAAGLKYSVASGQHGPDAVAIGLSGQVNVELFAQGLVQIR